MGLHSLQPTSMLDAAAGYLPWGRDLKDWIRGLQNISNYDRDQHRKLRAARAVMETALRDVNEMIGSRQDETAEGNEAVHV